MLVVFMLLYRVVLLFGFGEADVGAGDADFGINDNDATGDSDVVSGDFYETGIGS
ncbi:hypothetical protein DPMN_146788 [Dreissena polymorpha]|uniref:Uncharacterized protein n=1 Tax=Dreissena polymorpha TaxID=45954 RepID=A0A9D4IYQ9_DREPO|nr:hypothetical protein DPMN_146788 [Dreissena polymorpha]